MEFIVDEKVLELDLKIRAVVISDIDNQNIRDDFNCWRETRLILLSICLWMIIMMLYVGHF